MERDLKYSAKKKASWRVPQLRRMGEWSVLKRTVVASTQSGYGSGEPLPLGKVLTDQDVEDPLSFCPAPSQYIAASDLLEFRI